MPEKFEKALNENVQNIRERVTCKYYWIGFTSKIDVMQHT